MYKVTPNPPHASKASSFDAKSRAAAQRAIDHYLSPSDGDSPTARTSGHLFSVSPDIDTETLLANASETLLSANEMATALAFELEGSPRALALGIQ
ncbi:hypothetical protein HKK55_15935 [Pseudomonas sp. ADAK18]|uniref:DUF6124 family protein n=1 Tax=Pseudomonas sp. ADAK18 TaxID=2730848 RepID=UPI001463B131|nr:DUF6124 family protein [Pseudomonas sp. ADAK18]QJI30127.1 hypothetical protein HKK55_15935 [Pseudomonas sp. ADAK18]